MQGDFMKKIIVLIMILSVVILCGCKSTSNTGTENNVVPTNANGTATQDSQPANNEKPADSEFDNIDWESPIDVDESFLENNESTEPTETTDPTEGTTPADPSETDPADPTDIPPVPSDPAPSEPDTTKPEPEPGINKDPNTGAIELPMIPG